MPNTGRPSSGCYTCRARRIKCDRGEPGCRKCKTFGRPCPGYRDEAALLFRDQNDYAKVKVLTRPYRTRYAGGGESDPLARVCVTLPRSLPLNFEGQCIDQFFAQYVMSEGRTGYGYLDFVPGICASSDAYPCLKSALPAVALANAAKQRSQPELLQKAREKYGETLSLFNQTLRGSSKSLANDSVCLTILMLSLYELITGEGFLKDFWDSHHFGRLILLRVRAKYATCSRPAWNLFRVMHTYLLIGCLSMRVPPPEKSAQWLRQSYFTGPIEEECILMIEAVQIVSDVQGVALSCPEPLRSRKLYHILQQGIELDRKLTHWAGSLPSIWKYSSILNKSTSAAIPKCIHVHEDLFAAATWNNWRVVRIRLLQTLVAVAELVSEDERIFECHFLRWQKTIRDLADDVCSSTPYLLGEIDGQGVPRSVAKGVALGGYTLLHPLYVVISVRGLPASLYHWIEGKLTYIADVLGIGQANLVRKQHKMQIHFPVIGDVVSESERITPHLKGGQ